MTRFALICLATTFAAAVTGRTEDRVLYPPGSHTTYTVPAKTTRNVRVANDSDQAVVVTAEPR